MKTPFLILLSFALFICSAQSQQLETRSATSFDFSQKIEFIEVGDIGRGQVDYGYMISRYEITNNQYLEFLNSIARIDPNGIYNPMMEFHPSGGIRRIETRFGYRYFTKRHFGNKPVVFVRWIDAVRFTNWLHNEKPKGRQNASTTENGAYDLSLGVDSYRWTHRNADALYGLPKIIEWRKANLYDASANRFWVHATRTNDFPDPSFATGTGDSLLTGQNIVNHQRLANWNNSTEGNVTTVGSAGSTSYYGTSDGNGNVAEWTSDLKCISSLCARLIHGGSFTTPAPNPNCTSCVSPFSIAFGPIYGFANPGQPTGELWSASNVGFRVVKLYTKAAKNTNINTDVIPNIDIAPNINKSFIIWDSYLIAR